MSALKQMWGTGKEIRGARRAKAMPRHARAPASVYVLLRNFQLLRGRKRRSCIRSKYSRQSAVIIILTQCTGLVSEPDSPSAQRESSSETSTGPLGSVNSPCPQRTKIHIPSRFRALSTMVHAPSQYCRAGGSFSRLVRPSHRDFCE